MTLGILGSVIITLSSLKYKVNMFSILEWVKECFTPNLFNSGFNLLNNSEIINCTSYDKSDRETKKLS